MALLDLLQSFEGLILGGGGVVLGGGLIKLEQILRQRRGDTIGQQQAMIVDLRGELDKAKTGQDKMAVRVTRYQVMIQALQGRIDVLESATALLHAGADPFIIYQFTNPVGQVITDEAGNITDVDVRVRPILHYQAAELRGKNFKLLIPPEVQEIHAAFMVRARDPAIPLDPRNVLSLILMAKEGSRIPVNLRILRWKEEGHWQFTAYIQSRDVLPNGNGGNGSSSGDSGISKSDLPAAPEAKPA